MVSAEIGKGWQAGFLPRAFNETLARVSVIVFLPRIIPRRTGSGELLLPRWQVKSHGNRSGTRVDSVFPVVPSPPEPFRSRIFNLYHFPVRNVTRLASSRKKNSTSSRALYVFPHCTPDCDFLLLTFNCQRCRSLPHSRSSR